MVCYERITRKKNR